MFAPVQENFSNALLDPEQPVPAALTAYTARVPAKRFAVYRNNVTCQPRQCAGRALSGRAADRRRGIFSRDGAGLRARASAALAAADGIWRRLRRIHCRLPARGRTSVSCRCRAARSGAHARVSRRRCGARRRRGFRSDRGICARRFADRAAPIGRNRLFGASRRHDLGDECGRARAGCDRGLAGGGRADRAPAVRRVRACAAGGWRGVSCRLCSAAHGSRMRPKRRSRNMEHSISPPISPD
jgi:hypothetical protein